MHFYSACLPEWTRVYPSTCFLTPHFAYVAFDLSATRIASDWRAEDRHHQMMPVACSPVGEWLLCFKPADDACPLLSRNLVAAVDNVFVSKNCLEERNLRVLTGYLSLVLCVPFFCFWKCQGSTEVRIDRRHPSMMLTSPHLPERGLQGAQIAEEQTTQAGTVSQKSGSTKSPDAQILTRARDEDRRRSDRPITGPHSCHTSHSFHTLLYPCAGSSCGTCESCLELAHHMLLLGYRCCPSFSGGRKPRMITVYSRE